KTGRGYPAPPERGSRQAYNTGVRAQRGIAEFSPRRSGNVQRREVPHPRALADLEPDPGQDCRVLFHRCFEFSLERVEDCSPGWHANPDWLPLCIEEFR